MKLDAEKIVKLLEQNSGEIRSYGVKELQLSGSYVQGEDTQESDVDLLVEFKQDRGGFDDYTGLKQFLEDIPGEEVDLVKKDKVREELRENILGGERLGAKI